MILTCFVFAIVISLSSPVAGTPSELARAREVTAQVNGTLARMELARFRAQRRDVDFASEVRAWRESVDVRKVEVTDLDDSGSVVSEYYFSDGELVFAYVAIKGWQDGREVTRNERRLYFRDGSLVQWLDGMDKVLRAADDPEYAAESRVWVDAARFYRDAAVIAFHTRRP